MAASAALVLALSACGGSVGAGSDEDGGGDGDALTIGLLAPITGPVSNEGNALKRGFDLAVEQINDAGGVLGQPIEVVFLDDKADPALATQSANRLVTESQVDYLFGTITGDTAIAVAEVAAAAEVPFSTAILGTGATCGDYVWPFGETDPMMLEPLVPYMLEAHGPRVALVGSDYVFPRNFNGMAADLITAAGGEVVVEEYSPLGTSDWQPVVGKIASAQPDWILSAVVGGDAVAFVRQADEFGLLETTEITGVSLIQDYYPAMGGVTDGRELVGRYSEALPGEANEEFVEAFREAYDWQDPIPGVAATAFEGVRFVAQAVENAGTTESSALVEAMAETTVEGIFGESRFADNQTFETSMHLMRIEAGGNYVPVEDFGAISDPAECQ